MQLQCATPDCRTADLYSGSKARQQRKAAEAGWTNGPRGPLCPRHGSTVLTVRRRVHPLAVFVAILAVAAVLLYLGSR